MTPKVHQAIASSPLRCAPPRGTTISPELLSRMRPIAKRMANKTGGVIDEDDFFDAGLLGLANALSHWEEGSMTGDFAAYALICARNAMRQELRDRDPLPRGQRTELRDVKRVESRLAHDLGRTPRASEVAREAGLSFDAYRVIIEAGHVEHVEIEDISDSLAAAPSSSRAHGSMQPTEASVDLLRRVERLYDEVDQLPSRLAEVVRLYYHEGMTQREIGELLNVSNARVCQLLRGAVEELRGRITQPGADGKLTLSPVRTA